MGSPFASHSVSDPIPLPFDEGQWVQVRTLTGREIEAAQESHRATLAQGPARLWAQTFRRALRQGTPDAELLRAIADPLTGYDRFALVRGGLVAWSYPQPIAKNAAPGTTDAVEDLVDEAVDFIATEVLRKTKPALFVTTEADVERAQKELSVAVPLA